MSRLAIGDGFSVDETTFEKYWLLISDEPPAVKYREQGTVTALQNERQKLHDALVKSGGFDPELRYKSDAVQKSTGYFGFCECLEDFIAKRLLREETGVSAWNKRLLGQ